MMMAMTHRPCATLSDHDDIIYSPFLFTVRCDLEQSARACNSPCPRLACPLEEK